MTRPSWDEYALALADVVSRRADCSRRKVGAVILDKDNRVASTGYNGSYPGGPSCLAGDCPRGRHYRSECVCTVDRNFQCTPAQHAFQICACGKDWLCPDAVEPGSSYDTGPGACIAVHAEANAVLFSDRARLDGATIYITDAPCGGCKKMLRSTRIKRVVWPEGGYVHGE